MPEKREAPVRISGDHKAIAERIAKGVKPKKPLTISTVMELAIEALEDYFDAHKGRLLLPLNYDHVFQVVPVDDGRHRVFHEPVEISGSDPEPHGRLSSSRKVPVKPGQHKRGKPAVRARG